MSKFVGISAFALALAAAAPTLAQNADAGPLAVPAADGIGVSCSVTSEVRIRNCAITVDAAPAPGDKSAGLAPLA